MTTPFPFCLPQGGSVALAALLLGLAPAARAQASFATAVTYSVGGTSPLGVASADFNGDGRVDVVTANQDTDDVSVLLGQANPAGSLGVPVRYGTGNSGSRPTGVAVGDVNGDGRPDIVTANQATDNVAVLLNQPAAPGTFGNATLFATGGMTPNLPKLADLNGDGRLDIAVGNLTSGTVAVLLASPTTAGSFQAATTYTVGGGPLGVTVGDINRDGRPDLVVASYGSNGAASVLFNSATTPGTFSGLTTYPSGGTSAVDVVAGDVNGDGYLDLVLSNAGSNTVSVLTGTSTGTFGQAVSYPVIGEPNLLALADLNGDNRPDIAVGNRTAGTVSVLTGKATPTGTFASAVTYLVGSSYSPIGVTATDLNGDNRRDIVITNTSASSVSVLLNTYPLAAMPALAAAEVSLYPNPARGTFTVQLPALAATDAAQAELLDALGRVVGRPALHPLPDARLAVDAAGLPAGPYTLRLQATAWQLMRGVVLE